MGGIFSGPSRSPTPQQTESQLKAEEAQERADERATSQERTEMQGAQNRRRLLRRGGMRLLFSPVRQEGPGSPKTRKLGGGS
tara:strand:+ start:258 stop:503 length:246 start_codon:yes stop_codon:yes gene_type:complete